MIKQEWEAWKQNRIRSVHSIPSAKKKSLQFFAYDFSYYVEGPLHPIDPPMETSFLTSTGEKRKAYAWARVKWKKKGKIHTLTLYKLEDLMKRYPNHLFLPFMDSEAGETTYGGGRYLDVEEKNGKVLIDFNYAYNPDCAYGIPSSCPIAPEENRLPFPVRAGEKMPQ